MATPNTDIILKEYANGVRNVKTGNFYPFKAYKTSVSSGGTVTPLIGSRIYLWRAKVSYSAINTDAGTAVTLTSTLNGESQVLISLRKTTLVVDEMNFDTELHVLLDKGAVITFTASDISLAIMTLIYAEVDDLG